MGEKSFREYLLAVKVIKKGDAKPGISDHDMIHYLLDTKKMTVKQCMYLFEGCLEWRGI